MHILVISQVFSPSASEGSGRINDVVAELLHRGHTVDVICSHQSYMTGRSLASRANGRPQWLKEEGAWVLRCWAPSSRMQRRTSRALALLTFMAQALPAALFRRPRPDRVVVSSPPPTAAVVGCIVKRLLGPKLIYELRDLWLTDIVELDAVGPLALQRVAANLERRFIEYADTLIVVTPGLARRVKALVKAPKKQHVVPNGVDLRKFRMSTDDQVLQAESREFRLVCAGALGVNNDIETLVHAAKHLEHDSSAHIYLIGDGSGRERAEETCKTLGLRNVTFLGWMPSQKVAEALQTYDAAIAIATNNPLNSVAYANRAFEGMASGLPIICAIDGDMAELIRSADAGIVAPAGSAIGIADAIRKLEHMEESQRRAMGARGRALVEERFDRSSTVSSVCNLIATGSEIEDRPS